LDQELMLHRINEVQVRLDAMEDILQTLLNQITYLTNVIDDIKHKLG
jgi:hypothetical protein